jgi:cell fate regulator YaaT (PSP1 superfamily)
MSNVICSCLLGDNAKVRLRLSQLLHNEIAEIYGESEDNGEHPGICEVELQGCRREFFNNPSALALEVGQQVIVATDGGFDYGIVYSTGLIARKKLKLKGLDKPGADMLDIIRLADEEDKQHIRDLRQRKNEIREICLGKIKKHCLELKLVDIELRMDQQKLSVYYTSAHRVDFRSLVRDLAGEFKARIQMVQITTREEARRANSFGPCGCLLCCSSWLPKIHANPFADKSQYPESGSSDSHAFNITGICNRPKCCLGYSKHDRPQSACQAAPCSIPPAGSRVSTPSGEAVVESVDTQKKFVLLRYVRNDQKRKVPFDKCNTLFVRK